MHFFHRTAKKRIDRLLSTAIPGEEASFELREHITNTIDHLSMTDTMPVPQPPIPMQKEPTPRRAKVWFALVPIGAAVVLIIGVAMTLVSRTDSPAPVRLASAAVETFASPQEFSDYLAAGQAMNSGMVKGVSGITGGNVFESAVSMPDVDTATTVSSSATSAQTEPSRASQTNVQVQGIDEPDRVKTDGKHIFVSQEQEFYAATTTFFDTGEFTDGIVGNTGIVPPDQRKVEEPQTFAISALPANALSTSDAIDKNGELLLHNNTLLIFGTTSVVGYDVSKAPAVKKWEYTYGKNTEYFTARLIGSTVYLVSSTAVSRGTPCPLVMLKNGDDTAAQLSCSSIYHPVSPMPTDRLYTITTLDAVSGKVADSKGFTGGYNTIVYMSPTSLYLTFDAQVDKLAIVEEFLNSAEMKNVMNDQVRNRLAELKGYTLSQDTKLNELMVTIDDVLMAGTDKEAEALAGQFEKALEKFAEEHKRELQQTGIARFDLTTLNLAATGVLPGQPLNQFSLDEYNNYLRVTTTIGGSTVPMFDLAETVNDLVIYDSGMKQVSSVQDLGNDERIYSTRFVDGVAYMVTFKQTDPFFTFDLSDPLNPRVRGELKIPGFSSYLHPISATRVLGIGAEEGRVKATLFDVSNLDAPKALSTYAFTDAYWSAVANDHHAFLLDPDHQVFFMPAGQKGYVIGYANDTLTLKKEVTSVQAQRAVYVNNNLYVIGKKKIQVIAEDTWKDVSEYLFDK